VPPLPELPLLPPVASVPPLPAPELPPDPELPPTPEPPPLPELPPPPAAPADPSFFGSMTSAALQFIIAADATSNPMNSKERFCVLIVLITTSQKNDPPLRRASRPSS
jgi:hypothetical protein